MGGAIYLQPSISPDADKQVKSTEFDEKELMRLIEIKAAIITLQRALGVYELDGKIGIDELMVLDEAGFLTEGAIRALEGWCAQKGDDWCLNM